jgi:hypothetical protein
MGAKLFVPFHGEGSGVGELTWGQKGIWQTIRLSGESVTMGGVDPLPPGATVENAAATLQYVMARHQSLRTRLRIDPDGHTWQVVSSEGEIPLEVVDVAAGEDPAEVADAVCKRYQSHDFDYAEEWPLRMAVIRRDGTLTHAVAVYLHLAMDAGGLDVLMADSRTQRESPPVTAIQPLQLAWQQQQPAALRQGEASLRHLEQVLRTIAPRRFGRPTGGPVPGFEQVSYESAAMQLANQAVAARTGFGTNPVLLAAFAVTLARHTGINPVVVVLPVSNRFRPGFAGMVSPVAQISPCVVDLAGISFSTAISRSAKASMHAFKHAYYDPDERLALLRRVDRERGEPIDISCFFNDRRGLGRPQPTGPVATEAQVRDALPGSRLRWTTGPGLSKQKLYLSINDTPDAIELSLSADTEHLSTVDMEAIVRGIEAVLVEMVADPAGPTGVPAPAPSVAPAAPALG